MRWFMPICYVMKRSSGYSIAMLASAVVLFIVPLVLWKPYESPLHTGIMDLWAMTGTAIWTLWLLYFAIKDKGIITASTVTSACLIIISLHFISFIGLTSREPHFDYCVYQKGAQALAAGQNPYLIAEYTLNFPFLAEGIYSLFKAQSTIAVLTGRALSDATIWNCAFYFFENIQLALVMTGFWLTAKWIEKISGSNFKVAILTAGVWLLSGPIHATIRQGQINLALLVTVLVALLTIKERPIIAGFASSVGMFLKVYPMTFVGAYLVNRRWVAAASFLFASLLLVAAQTLISPPIFSQMLAATMAPHISQFPGDADSLRQPTLYTLAHRIWWQHGLNSETFRLAPALTVACIIAALIVWFTYRLIQRRKTKTSAEIIAPDHILYGDCLDMLALLLLVSPHVWEHHYILATPLLVWLLAKQPTFLTCGAASLLLLDVPWDFLFPYSQFMKPLGLLLLLYQQQRPPSTSIPIAGGS